MSDAAATINIKGLYKLLKALKQKQPVVRVGILGDKTQRTENKTKLSFSEVQNLVKPRKSGKQLTNAELGALHEFGGANMPQRSFLRMPLTERLNKEMQRSGAFSEQAFKGVMQQGTVIPWLKKLAVLAESIVLGAFDSGGYGKWPKWKKGYTNRTGMILVDSQQLRNSITSEVTER